MNARHRGAGFYATVTPAPFRDMEALRPTRLQFSQARRPERAASDNVSIVILRGPESLHAGAGACVPDAVRARLAQSAADAGKTIALRSCRSEAELVEGLSGLRSGGVELLLFDPGACAQASERLRRALEALDTPYIEVHDDDMDAPEPSLAPHGGACLAQVHGYAAQSYTLALAIALEHLGCAECGHGVHVGT